MKKDFILFCIVLGIIVMLGITLFVIREQTNTNRTAPDFKSDTTFEDNIVSEVKEIERDPNKVTMTIKEGTLTKKSAVIVITDNNEQPYPYEEEFWIDKKKNGEWKKLELINKNHVNSEIGILRKSGKSEKKVDWTKLYGELKKGEYRLVKELTTDQYIWVEFTIDK